MAMAKELRSQVAAKKKVTVCEVSRQEVKKAQRAKKPKSWEDLSLCRFIASSLCCIIAEMWLAWANHAAHVMLKLTNSNAS